LFDGYWRKAVDRGVKPIGNGLARAGVTPDQLTVLGLTMSVATAVAIASGHLMLGFWLLLLSAFPDLFDGAVAKASDSSSVRGAFFDSVADRVTDGFLLGGIAWYLGNRHSFQAAMLAFAVLGVSTLISYERAKAESLGFEAKGGLMERAERIIAICAGLVFNILIPVLWVMLVLTSFTAVQRFVKVWRQADRPPVPVRPQHPIGRRGPRVDRVRLADRLAWSRRERVVRSGRTPVRFRVSSRPASARSPRLGSTWRQRARARAAARRRDGRD
jgi:CDP-diacylglycerol--glycerol-3-phosphate 3-phosphatidyltransferase